MQFSISGIFQKNEQDLFRFTVPESAQPFQLKIKSLTRNPLTFVVLVWALMFFFASLYFVYAQETGKPVSGNHHVSQKARASSNAKTAAKKRTVPAKKTETVEVFSVGLEAVSADFSRKATAGEERPNE